MNLPPVVRDKLQLRLLSLIFAAMLWFFVTLQGGDEIELPLTVRFINTPAQTALRSDSLPRFSVRISGARILLLRQKFRGAEAWIDLSGATAGRFEFAGLERFVRLDDGIRLLGVSPGTLTVELENTKSTVAQ